MGSFIRRLFGLDAPDDVAEADAPWSETEAGAMDAPPAESTDDAREGTIPAAPSASCPYCGYIIQPAPVRSRLCPSCRRRIIVRRIDGRSVLLVDSAVPIFDRERQRAADELSWASERDHWLGLAELLRAPANRRARVADAALSESAVDDARALYMSGAERMVRAAKTAKRWPDVARLRRQQAGELYRDAGSPVPPPEAVIALQREGMLAELRALASVSNTAELVSAGCCRVCRADDEKTFPIAAELRDPRLPHEGCAKGLCPCQWWLAMPTPKKSRRRQTAKVAAARGGTVALAETDEVAAKADMDDGDEAHRSIQGGID